MMVQSVGLAASKDLALFFVRWEPEEGFEQKRDGVGWSRQNRTGWHGMTGLGLSLWGEAAGNRGWKPKPS